jgi:hypothetical protein
MKFFHLLALVGLIFSASGCNPYNNAGEGAATGGALGALAGGIIGHQSGEASAGLLIGGALGAVTGAAVGSSIQKPEPPEPVIVEQHAAATLPTTTYSGDTVTVNVPNANTAGYTAVVLKRSGNGFVGPQGEYYDEVPSVEQLQVMYAR